MKMTSFTLLALFTLSAHAEMYKWVDEEGVTHYSQMPPVNRNTQAFREGAAITDNRDAVDASADAAAAGLNCKRAVTHAIDAIDTMLAAGEKGLADGDTRQDEFTSVSAQLRKVRQQISISECLVAQGETKAFYSCIASEHNRVADCSKQYRYGE